MLKRRGKEKKLRVKLRTRLCDLLEIEYPVFLAGMGTGVSGSDLAAAVSNAGGLGMLGCSRLSPDQIREIIHRTRALTPKPFGVDILAPALKSHPSRDDLRKQIPSEYWEFVKKMKKEWDLPDVPTPSYSMTEDFLREQMEVVVNEKVPIFATGLGTPSWLLEEIRAHKIKYISLVGKVKHALRLKENRPDVIVAQGTEAGGHTGKIGTFPLVPLIVDAVSPIPVLAAGGINDGRGMVAALALGAAGIWMGTAFLATHEAFHDAIRFGWTTREDADFYQEAIIKANDDDAVISRVKTGKTARMFKNKLIDLWEESGLKPLPYQLQTIIMSDLENTLIAAGEYEYVHHIGGQVAGKIKELKGAGELIQEVVEQAVSIIESGIPGVDIS